MAAISTAITDRSDADITNVSSTEVAAQNLGRQYLLIQNVSDVVLYVRFGAAASATLADAAGSFQLAVGASLIFEGESFVPSSSVNIIAASGTGKDVVVWEA